MSGKMFRGGDSSGLLRAFSKRRGKPRHVCRIFSVRTHVNHGIGGVIVYVNHRREDLLYTEYACFACGDLTLASRVFGIAGRSHGHVPGKVDGVVETHSGAGL